jgi:hypothetical protein
MQCLLYPTETIGSILELEEGAQTRFALLVGKDRRGVICLQ